MISVVATVLNEGEAIRPLLDSLVVQTYFPDEVVIVDGGSRDNTRLILREYENRLPLRIFIEPDANISVGRNRAIAYAKGDVIAVTDAGVTLARDWLERITRPLLDNPVIQVVGGFFQADPHSIFEAALGATTLPQADEIDPDKFLPSSRSIAFRKTAWIAAGGYPEWLDYCEDLIFDLRLRELGTPMIVEAGALTYFRPRPSLSAFYKQYYRYARGDGKADLWRKRHAIRYLTYLIAAPLIFLLGWRTSKLFWLLYIPGALVYFGQPYRRLRTVLEDATRTGLVRVTLSSNLQALALIPVIRVVGDIAKMIGYPVGWVWRIRNRPPDWRKV